MESLLDEKFLHQLETLKLLAQKGLKGRNPGIQKSRRSGSSMEFMDYRKYQPGDDIRYVDWNVYARTDRLFVKQFHAEKDVILHLLMDKSGSMAAPAAKFLFAKKIVAAISYMGLASQDQVGISAFNDTVGPIRSPERGKDVYLSVLNYLSDLEPGGVTDFNGALTAFAQAGHKPGVAVVVSDVLAPDGFKEGLKALVLSRFKLSLIQVLTPQERFPSFKGRFALSDVETGHHQFFAATKRMKQAYVEKMTAYIEGINTFCLGMGIDYHLADTGASFEDFFLGFLNSRHMQNAMGRM